MSTTISRTHYNALVDDSGSGLDGTIWDKAKYGEILDDIDALIAAAITFGSTISERNRSTPMGEWISVAFAAGNFTGNGSMTWTLASGDQTTFKYTLVGKTMTVSVVLATTTVGGTPNTTLRIAIPGGFTAAAAMSTTWEVTDNGATTRALAEVAAAGTLITIVKAAGGNWAAATDNTGVKGQITFEVQ
jgi:hypothetical protein